MDMYTDVERSIQQTLKAGSLARGYTYPIFNNMVSKKDIKDQRACMGVMKSSDTFQPANSGGTKSFIKTPVKVGGVIVGYTVQEWPDPFDLLYQFIIIADALNDARKLDQLIRDVLRPRTRLMLWDSTALAGAGAFTDKYCNFQYAGYINRDVPENSTYWRITNIRFEAFNYQETTTNQGVLSSVGIDFVLSQLLVQSQALNPTLGLTVSTSVIGVKNGVNNAFLLPSAPPNPNTVLVFYNGQFVPRVDDNGIVNWVIANNVFTVLGFRVNAGDSLNVVY